MPTTWQHDPSLYAPARYRRACSYEAFVPDPVGDVDPVVPGEVAGIVADAEAAIRDLNAVAHPALAPLARLLLRTESIASSKVEGIHVDARALARAEGRAESGGRLASTVGEVLANIDAMEVAIDSTTSRPRVSVPDIEQVHRALMHRSAPAIAGRIRDTQNWIGGNDHNPCGAAFVPPPPREVARLMADLCDLLDDERLSPLTQAALVHAQFETIHPFVDGNGRTGRALVHVVLRRRRLAPDYVPPISVSLAAHRSRYIEGLVAFREDDLSRWLSLFAEAAAHSAGLARAHLDAVRLLQDRWREQLRAGADPRSDSVAWHLIDVLPAYPVLSLPAAVAATGRTKAVVNAALGHLEDAGVLERLGGGERNRTWEASGLLDLLEALESAAAPPRGLVADGVPTATE
ncbi:MAG: Fic family protein [Kineosporiaceae bacterium]